MPRKSAIGRNRDKPNMKAYHIYLGLFVIWLMFLVYPPVALPFGFVITA
jgi:hypothetical protein